MFAKENKRKGEKRRAAIRASDATSERNHDTVTSAPSFFSVYRYSLLFASSLTASTCFIQLNC